MQKKSSINSFSYVFNVDNVYFSDEDNETQVKCFLAHPKKGSEFDILLFTFEVVERQSEPLQNMSGGYNVENDINRLAEISRNCGRPVNTTAIIKYGSVIVNNM